MIAGSGDGEQVCRTAERDVIAAGRLRTALRRGAQSTSRTGEGQRFGRRVLGPARTQPHAAQHRRGPPGPARTQSQRRQVRHNSS